MSRPYVLRSFALPDEVRPADLSVLSSGELERVDAQRTQRGRAHMAASRASLRRLLGRVMAVPPEHVPIRVEPTGRPTVAGGPPFSIARDDRIVVIGLAARSGTRIGVDVVSPPSGWRASDLAPTVLDPVEQERLVGLSRCDADRLLLRMWSLKEARLKGSGVGLWIEPDACTTRLLDASRALVAAPDGGGTWPADTLPVGSSVVSVAWRGAG